MRIRNLCISASILAAVAPLSATVVSSSVTAVAGWNFVYEDGIYTKTHGYQSYLLYYNPTAGATYKWGIILPGIDGFPTFLSTNSSVGRWELLSYLQNNY